MISTFLGRSLCCSCCCCCCCSSCRCTIRVTLYRALMIFLVVLGEFRAAGRAIQSCRCGCHHCSVFSLYYILVLFLLWLLGLWWNDNQPQKINQSSLFMFLLVRFGSSFPSRNLCIASRLKMGLLIDQVTSSKVFTLNKIARPKTKISFICDFHVNYFIRGEERQINRWFNNLLTLAIEAMILDWFVIAKTRFR